MILLDALATFGRRVCFHGASEGDREILAGISNISKSLFLTSILLLIEVMNKILCGVSFFLVHSTVGILLKS